MKIIIDIPDSLERSLREWFGSNPALAAKEALAIRLYRAEKLSLGRVAELLDASVYEADGLLKRHHVDLPCSLEEFENDQATLQRSLGS